MMLENILFTGIWWICWDLQK